MDTKQVTVQRPRVTMEDRQYTVQEPTTVDVPRIVPVAHTVQSQV